jgi:hypothetical protein
MTINIVRVILASLGALVAYFVFGGAVFVLLPSLKTEFGKYPGVYRDSEGQMSHMPAGMGGIFLAIVALAVLYAQSHPQPTDLKAGALAGLCFGVLAGLFVVGGFVIHNFANLRIGAKLAVQQAIAYFVEWVVVGVVIGMIYRPVGRL